MGCGAHCNDVKTQGLWTDEEKKLHINALEMKAVMFAVQSFIKDEQKIHVHLKVDNTTTVAYVNKMGGTKSLAMSNISKQLWDYCLQKEITITAEHLPGSLNHIADVQSRQYRDRSNWMLAISIFQALTKVLGLVEIDLFADRMKKQLDKYVSRKPGPGAWKTDAFSIKWTDLKAYAFPPFFLVGRCLAKILQDKATLVLITPVWPTQPWYTTILEVVMADPVLIPTVAWIPTVANLLTYPSEPSTSADGSKSFSSGVQRHRGSAGKQQISPKAKQLVNNARRPSSQTAYEPAWKR